MSREHETMRLDEIEAPRAAKARSQFTLSLAETPADVVAAQRLRYRVFAEEQGADLPDAHLGLDRDRYDDYCDHLLVREAATGAVRGTYRILDAEQAKRAGGFYSESEFDLSRLRTLPGSLVEVGRACIAPEYRRGAVLSLLLSGLAHHIRRRGYDYAIGCASIHVGTNAAGVASICERILRTHRSPEEWRVYPRRPLTAAARRDLLEPPLPPLLRAYLKMGAWIGGEPAYDPDFDTADLLVMLPMAQMSERYAHRLLKAA
jgi:putative hemolysin